MADQSSVCQTGLSPATPNGAPFSCLVGGGAGGRDGRRGGGVGEEGREGVQIERLTERVQGRERQLDRQAGRQMEKDTNKKDTGKQMRADRQLEGDSND